MSSKSKPSTTRQRVGSKRSDTWPGRVAVLTRTSLDAVPPVQPAGAARRQGQPPASAQAELVAFRIGHGVPGEGPLVGLVEEPGPAFLQRAAQGVLVRVGIREVDVPVHAVLHALRFRDQLEEDALAG